MGTSASSNRTSFPCTSSLSTTGAYRKEIPRPSATRDLMVSNSLIVTILSKLSSVSFKRCSASSKIARVPEPSSRRISRSPYNSSKDTLRPARRCPGSHTPKKILSAEQLRLISAALKKALDQYKIHLSLLQRSEQCLGIVHQQGKIGLRVGPEKAFHLGGDHILSNGFGGSYPHGNGRFCRHSLLDFLTVLGHGASKLPQPQSCLSQPKHFSLIGKQLAAVILLQIVDVVGHPGLSQTQPLSRPGIVHGFAQHQNVFQRGSSISITYYLNL